MDEKTYEDELPDEVHKQAPSSKAWLKNTDKSLARLQNVKKTSYRLGGGPKEREVNCQCNYRSKHHSSFVNMDADPPQLSQESQETASYQNVSISDLVKAQKKNKESKPKQKRRPYSATVHHADYATSQEEKAPVSKGNKTFISVKGLNLNPKIRPKSASYGVQSQQSSKGCLWHLDPDHVQREEQVTLEGLRKYSAYGQDDDTSTDVGLPMPPRVSPDIPDYILEENRHNVSPDQLSSDGFWEDDDLEGELQPLSEQGDHTSSSPKTSKPLIFQIPTAELCEFSDDETARDTPGVTYGSDHTRTTGDVRKSEAPSMVYSKPPKFQVPTAELYDFGDDETAANTPRGNDRALSADYVEKSEAFLDELSRKQTQEAQELSEMFSEMNQNQEKIENIDIRSVMSTPTSARHATEPHQETSGVSILNIALQQPERTIGEIPTDSVWVEEPYIPRIKPNQETSHVPIGRFHSPKPRVQSATRRRTQEEGAFVLQGKTFELMDAKDLAVPRRLSDKATAEKDMGQAIPPQKDEVLGKPPRPKSSSLKKKKRENSASLNSKQRKSHGHDREEISQPPILSHPRKSSMRKSLSQGDVRCLSPEVIASVKKTVSFSDEVLDKPTRLLKSSEKEPTKGADVSKSNDSVPEAEVCKPEVSHKNDIAKTEGNEPEVKFREMESSNLEYSKPKVENVHNRLDSNENISCSTYQEHDIKPAGVVIQNGEEAKQDFTRSQQKPIDKSPDKPVNVIARVKEATRCSCHVDGCHCRDITRPTMAVLSQAKAAANEPHSTSPKHKLLKHRPSRPISAPIRRDFNSSTKNYATNDTSIKQKSTTQHRRSGSEGRRRPRPVSAHIKRPSGRDPWQNYPQNHPPSSKDSKPKKTKAKSGQADNGFVWGAGSEDVAASEECEEVYAKFKEKGIAISMETVKRGLMAPARRASESCMASFGSSSSSGLLSRPEKWLPDEYKRVKIWDDVLKKL